MSNIVGKMATCVAIVVLILTYFVPMVEAANDNTPPVIKDLGSHTRTKDPGRGLYCKLVSYGDPESGIYKVDIANGPGTNVDGTYPDVGADSIIGNERTWLKKPKKIYIDVCYVDKTKPIVVTTTARNGDGFDTTVTFNNPPKPADGLLSYGARVKHGQNAYLTVWSSNFGDTLAGSMAFIAKSFDIGNTGDAAASLDVKMESNESASGRYGLLITGGTSTTYSGDTIITADNLAFGNETDGNYTYLNETGSSVYVGDVAPGTNVGYDAKLVVPSNVAAGDYVGSIQVIFGNVEPTVTIPTPPP